MDRRTFVTSTAAATVAMASGTVFGSDSSHHKHVGLKSSGIKDQLLQKVVNSSSECVKAGEACLQHCLLMLASGDKSMGRCMASVQNMLASCESMRKVATFNTSSKKTILAFANACALICDECIVTCKEHAKKHKECNACMLACEECAKTCRNLT